MIFAISEQFQEQHGLIVLHDDEGALCPKWPPKMAIQYGALIGDWCD
jgi:hypothetical protein